MFRTRITRILIVAAGASLTLGVSAGVAQAQLQGPERIRINPCIQQPWLCVPPITLPPVTIPPVTVPPETIPPVTPTTVAPTPTTVAPPTPTGSTDPVPPAPHVVVSASPTFTG